MISSRDGTARFPLFFFFFFFFFYSQHALTDVETKESEKMIGFIVFFSFFLSFVSLFPPAALLPVWSRGR
jgi:hypothetical protein